MPDPDRYLHHYAHCDVLVIGAGPAGLAAALAASASGARVVLCDEQSELGGSLLAETEAHIDGDAASDWLRETLDTLGRCADVTLLPRTTAFGWYPDNLIGLVERVTDHLAEPDSAAAARTAVARAGRQGRDCHRRIGTAAGCSPATTGRASCWPMPRGSICSATA